MFIDLDTTSIIKSKGDCEKSSRNAIKWVISPLYINIYWSIWLILKNNKQVLVKLKEKKIDDLFPLLFNLKLLWVLIICWLSDWLCGTRWSTLWSRKHGGHLPRSQRQGHVSFSYIHCKPNALWCPYLSYFRSLF